MTRLLVVSFSLAACSGRAPAPTGPDEPRGSAAPEAGSGTEPGSASTGPSTAATKVTEAECHAMIDHIVELDLKARPADQQIPADQKAEIQAQFRAAQTPACLQQPKTAVACATVAPTIAAVLACQP